MNLLYSTRHIVYISYIYIYKQDNQYLVITYNGKESEKGYTHTHTYV